MAVKKKRIARNKVIEFMTVTSDNGMDSVETETFFCKVNAAIWPINARESIENMRVGVKISNRINVRYRPGIEESMRIVNVVDGRKFEILGIINIDEADKDLDILANELI